MNDDAQKIADRAMAALRRAQGSLDAMQNAAAAEGARMQSDMADVKATADAIARMNAELTQENNSLTAEVEALKEKERELSARAVGSVSSEEIERILKDRERDLAEFDALLAELRELVGERDA